MFAFNLFDEQLDALSDELRDSMRKVLADRDQLLVALEHLSTAASGLDPLRDDDSRAEAYADELKALSEAQDEAREVIEKLNA